MFEKQVNKARGEGRGTGGSAQGDGGAKYCICPKCGYSQEHEKGKPCIKIKCPKCGATLKGSDTKKRIISKPYPNYHAARIKSPGLFVRVRVFRTSKEGIMFYGGPLKGKPAGATELQSIRFPKSKFTTAEAKSWLKEHKQSYILFEPAVESKKKLWPTISGEVVND